MVRLVNSWARSHCGWLRTLAAALGAGYMVLAQAGGGLLGIDHRLNLDQSGIWARHDQLLLEDLTLVTVVGGALWEGGDSRFGQTYWQSLDASVLAAISATAAKDVFTRA